MYSIKCIFILTLKGYGGMDLVSLITIMAVIILSLLEDPGTDTSPDLMLLWMLLLLSVMH